MNYSFVKNATLFAEVLDEWKQERTGPLTDTGNNNVLWLRTSNDSAVFGEQSDPSAGVNTPQLEIVIVVRQAFTATSL